MSFSWDAYYAKVKGPLSETRQARYRDDPAYRAKVLEANKKTREARKAREREARMEELAAIQLHTSPGESKARTITVDVDGVPTEVPVFTLGAVSRVTQRAIVTLHKWEKEGRFPPTPHRDENGFRLYTAEQVKVIMEVASGHRAPTALACKRSFAPRSVTVVTPSGPRTVKVFRIGALLQVIGRTREAWLGWETVGLVPLSPIKGTTRGHRLFTAEMIDVVRGAVEALNGSLRSVEAKGQFRDAVHLGWQQLGVMDWKMQE